MSSDDREGFMAEGGSYCPESGSPSPRTPSASKLMHWGPSWLPVSAQGVRQLQTGSQAQARG